MFSRHDKTILHPLFGTYCLTEQFRVVNGRVTEHSHLEAWLDDPVKKTWSVSKVTNQIEASKAFKTKTGVVRKKTSFSEALAFLAAEEKKWRRRVGSSRLLPTAADMEYLHFRAFAEREGYLFDKHGYPHARPAFGVLPPNAEFLDTDITDADAHLKRPPQEFGDHGLASQLPHTHFLFDYFAHNKYIGDFGTAMNELRVLDIMDHYVMHISDMHQLMQEYADSFEAGKKSHLVMLAEDALKVSHFSLTQLKAYGVDITQFDTFNKQCQLACHVLHASALYQLMRSGKLEIATTEPLFKTRVKQAEDLVKILDPSPKADEIIKAAIIQTGQPPVPQSIDIFIKNYHAQKKQFYGQKPPAPPHP